MRSEEEINDATLWQIFLGDGLTERILKRKYKELYYCPKRHKHIGVLNKQEGAE